MTFLWALPVLVTLLGVAAVVVAAGRAVEEARRLGTAIGRLRSARPLVIELLAATRRLRGGPTSGRRTGGAAADPAKGSPT